MRASSMSRPNAFRLSSSQCLWSVSALWSALSLCPLLLPYMKSHNTFHPVRERPSKASASVTLGRPFSNGVNPSNKAGFTLVEVLITLAIVVFIGVMGVVIGLDSYQKYLFRSDLDTAAALLSKARSSAVHSIGETSHGVYFGDNDYFVLFRGASYGDDPSFDLLVEKSKVTTITGSDEVVFSPLSGDSTNESLTLSNGIQDFNITINEEGGINW